MRLLDRLGALPHRPVIVSNGDRDLGDRLAVSCDRIRARGNLGGVLGNYSGQGDVELRATGDRRAYFTAVRAGLLAWSAAGTDTGTHETWDAFGTRVGAGFDDCHRGLPRESRVLVVTSGGVIGRLVARTLGADAATAIALNLQARNTGITELVVGSSATRLVQFNAIPHLERADRVQAQTYS